MQQAHTQHKRGSIAASRWYLYWVSLCLLWALLGHGKLFAQTHAASEGASCTAQHLGSALALERSTGQRPAQGWQPVHLPYTVEDASLGVGPMWFRVQWQLHCPAGLPADPHLALAISGINQAAEVFWNDQLLWRSHSLVEPLSRGWNTPRWWPVTITDPQQIQTLWVRVVSQAPLEAGLGHVELGPVTQIEAMHEYRYGRQHTAYVVAASLAAAVACVALVVWAQRRQEKSYFWLGCMQAFWALYLSTILSQETWPGFTSFTFTAFSLSCLVLYAQCFVIFTLRFGGERRPWLERAAWLVVGSIVLLMLGGIAPKYRDAMAFLWCGFAFVSTGLYFQWRAWCTRKPQHLLLAVCWVVVLVLGIHDTHVALKEWYNFETLSAFYAPVVIMMLGVLLGWKVAEDMRRIDGFNAELQQRVAEAQTRLADSLAREHAQALQNAKIQERMQLAHDLHDGLGGSLVRSMAMIENAHQPVGNAHMLSMLKSLRDDLRQIIDAGSGSGAQVPATPLEWLAPLRHRVTQVLEALNVRVQWTIDARWQLAPSATQCLALLRILEEALANTIKHSGARQVRISCHQLPEGLLQLTVEDDGLGFDVSAVQQAALNVGMRSMQARAQRLSAQWSVQSQPGRTVVQVLLQVVAAHA